MVKVLWAVIFNFRPSTFETARFTDLHVLPKGLEKTQSKTSRFSRQESNFLSSLPDGQGPREAVRRLNFWERFWEEKVSFRLKGNQLFRGRNNSIVLLIAWRALTAQKWLPSTWSKSAPIKFLSRIKIAAMGTKTLCLFLKFSNFLRASFRFSEQNLTQQRYTCIYENCRNCTRKLRSRIFLPRKQANIFDAIKSQINLCFRRGNMQFGCRHTKWKVFPWLKLFFIHPNVKKYAFTGFSKFDTVPACVKTEVGRRFDVNSVCYKFLALLFTLISWS